MSLCSRFWDGPQPHDSAARRALAEKIAIEAQNRFGARFRGAALYGSAARGTDLPYSDVELFALIDGEHEESFEEWVWGPGRVELNVIGWETAQKMAADVESDWPLSRGQFIHAVPLAGDPAQFEQLRTQSLSVPEERFHAAMRAILLEELYELLGKLRNARQRRLQDPVPALASQFAFWMAMLLGLAHRHCFRNSYLLLKEALGLPSPPAGFDLLVRLVCDGRLNDLEETATAVENAWQGLEPWTLNQGLAIEALLYPPAAGADSEEAI
jgi:kanamycin nucleotidyltransferase